MIELVVTISLTLVVVGLLSRAAVSGRRALESLTLLAEEIETVRTARVLIERLGAGGEAFTQSGTAEVTVRFPVGWAERCDSSFVWRGLRLPDPERDSLLARDAGGRLSAVALDRAARSACHDSEGDSVGAWRFETTPVVDDAVLLRAYESGAVRIDDAVRYGRTGTARQPLTPAVLDAAGSGLRLDSTSLHVDLVSIRPGSWHRAWWQP